MKDADRVSRVLDLIRFWKPDDNTVFNSAAAAGAHLRELLAGHRILLVVDDVWSSMDIEPFRGLGAGLALLITTRNPRTLPSMCERVDVDAMRRDEAVELLGADLNIPDIHLLEILAERLGAWPLLLRLVNRQLLRYRERGLEGASAIERLEAQLARGLDKLEIGREENRAEAVSLTMQYSLDALDPKDRFRYLDLAIFPEDTDVPLNVVARLWQLDEVETEALCERLAALSLLRFDLVTETIRLHDVFREYLLGQHEDVTKLTPFLPGLLPSAEWTLDGLRRGRRLPVASSGVASGTRERIGTGKRASFRFRVSAGKAGDGRRQCALGRLRLLRGRRGRHARPGDVTAVGAHPGAGRRTPRGKTIGGTALRAPHGSRGSRLPTPVGRSRETDLVASSGRVVGASGRSHAADVGRTHMVGPCGGGSRREPRRLERPSPHRVRGPSSIDAILITAITREREAVLEELRAQQFAPVLTKHGGRYSYTFVLPRPNQDALRCLVVQPTDKGPNTTQSLTIDLLRTFEPSSSSSWAWPAGSTSAASARGTSS